MSLLSQCPRCGKKFYFSSEEQEAKYRSAWTMFLSTGKKKFLQECLDIDDMETLHTCSLPEDPK